MTCSRVNRPADHAATSCSKVSDMAATRCFHERSLQRSTAAGYAPRLAAAGHCRVRRRSTHSASSGHPRAPAPRLAACISPLLPHLFCVVKPAISAVRVAADARTFAPRPRYYIGGLFDSRGRRPSLGHRREIRLAVVSNTPVRAGGSSVSGAEKRVRLAICASRFPRDSDAKARLPGV